MEVQSEINPYFESDTSSKPVINIKNVLSRFPLKYVIDKEVIPEKDHDGDYVVPRKAQEISIVFVLEHSISTSLALVGQQLWRGAFLLSDLMVHLRHQLKGQTVVELGAGVGLTSLVTSLYAEHVICTDMDAGDIIPLLKENVNRNEALLKGKVSVMGLNWFDLDWPVALETQVKTATVLIAADVVYDNSVTEAFIRTITKMLSTPPTKTMYIALEKRYVFTTADLDTCAPCYEHLLHCIQEAQKTSPWNKWSVTHMPIDFPQVLSYDRIKQLVLWRIST